MWTKLTNQLCETSFYIDAFNNSLKTCLKIFDSGMYFTHAQKFTFTTVQNRGFNLTDFNYFHSI